MAIRFDIDKYNKIRDSYLAYQNAAQSIRVAHRSVWTYSGGFFMPRKKNINTQ